jgi:hypothetical protein
MRRTGLSPLFSSFTFSVHRIFGLFWISHIERLRLDGTLRGKIGLTCNVLANWEGDARGGREASADLAVGNEEKER